MLWKTLFAVSVIFLGTRAQAQTVADRAAALRKQYDSCVYDAVGTEWKHDPKINPNVATETAFLACATEEQAISNLLIITGAPIATVNMTISNIKLSLKSTVRQIMADYSAAHKNH